MQDDIWLFFEKSPKALPLYEAVADNIEHVLGTVRIKVSKTQIAFANKYQFAFVSLPVRKIKELPETCVILTFGLCRQLVHPRIWQSVEAYPNRWTHHTVISSPEQVDDEVMGWLKEAHDFALIK